MIAVWRNGFNGDKPNLNKKGSTVGPFRIRYKT